MYVCMYTHTHIYNIYTYRYICFYIEISLPWPTLSTVVSLLHNLSIYLPIYLSICLSVSLSVCLSILLIDKMNAKYLYTAS